MRIQCLLPKPRCCNGESCTHFRSFCAACGGLQKYAKTRSANVSAVHSTHSRPRFFAFLFWNTGEGCKHFRTSLRGVRGFTKRGKNTRRECVGCTLDTFAPSCFAKSEQGARDISTFGSKRRRCPERNGHLVAPRGSAEKKPNLA